VANVDEDAACDIAVYFGSTLTLGDGHYPAGTAPWHKDSGTSIERKVELAMDSQDRNSGTGKEPNDVANNVANNVINNVTNNVANGVHVGGAEGDLSVLVDAESGQPTDVPNAIVGEIVVSHGVDESGEEAPAQDIDGGDAEEVKDPLAATATNIQTTGDFRTETPDDGADDFLAHEALLALAGTTTEEAGTNVTGVDELALTTAFIPNVSDATLTS
jgi:hypothetical protein